MDKAHPDHPRRSWRRSATAALTGLAIVGGGLTGGVQPLWSAAPDAVIPAQASPAPQAPPQTERPEFVDLWQVLRLSDLIAIMVREGRAYGADLGQDMFPTRSGPAWEATVARIYNPARMERAFRADVASALKDRDLAPMLAFFDTPAGHHITGLEVSARTAMLDASVEEASREVAETLQDSNPALFGAISEFVAANDLVEMNVAGAMNANLAFYKGLMDGNLGPQDMTEGEILADIWAQEPDIREETETWVYSYLALAYRPLPEGMLADYTRFSRSDAGRALNSALFSAFDTLFVGISHDLGKAAAARMVGEDL